MLLDQLVETIETLRSRIQDHRAVLQGSEAQTRLSLIDPLLQALGWDISDPSMVRPEYVLSGKRADYALLNGQGVVVVFLEAKRLDEQLSPVYRSQVTGYANDLGIRYPALTNGDQWEVYDNSQMVPIEERRILNTSIAGYPSAKCALQFLLLWRPNMAPGQPMEASEPLLGTEFKGSPVQPRVETPARPPASAVPAAGWITLRDVDTTRNVIRPSAIRFPDGEERRVTMWLDILREVAEHLVREGALNPGSCPIPDRKYPDSVYVVNVRPEYPDGSSFYRPRELSNGLFLNGWGRVKEYVGRSIALMEHLGRDPSSVHLKVG